MESVVLSRRGQTGVMHHVVAGSKSALIATIIALGILSATISLASANLALVAGPQHAEIALDICHPSQVGAFLIHLDFAFPSASIPDVPAPNQDKLGLPHLARLIKGNLEPESPPPKSRV